MAWREIDTLIATKRPIDCDRAVRLIAGLRDGADRVHAFREQHAIKLSFIECLWAGLMPAARTPRGPRVTPPRRPG